MTEACESGEAKGWLRYLGDRNKPFHMLQWEVEGNERAVYIDLYLLLGLNTD